jgi:hypothetical protein
MNEPKELEQGFVEGDDYYFESGLMILTARFLLERGYCCSNGCRNCPYPKDEGQSKNSSNSL